MLLSLYVVSSQNVSLDVRSLPYHQSECKLVFIVRQAVHEELVTHMQNDKEPEYTVQGIIKSQPIPPVQLRRDPPPSPPDLPHATEYRSD